MIKGSVEIIIPTSKFWHLSSINYTISSVLLEK